MTLPLTDRAGIKRCILKAVAGAVFLAGLTFASLFGLWRFGSGEYLTDIKLRVVLTGGLTALALGATITNLWRVYRRIEYPEITPESGEPSLGSESGAK